MRLYFSTCTRIMFVIHRCHCIHIYCIKLLWLPRRGYDTKVFAMFLRSVYVFAGISTFLQFPHDICNTFAFFNFLISTLCEYFNFKLGIFGTKFHAKNYIWYYVFIEILIRWVFAIYKDDVWLPNRKTKTLYLYVLRYFQYFLSFGALLW